MTARILDGKAVAERLTRGVREAVDTRTAAGKPVPGLAVVLVGENAASQIYVRNKRRMTDASGMRSFAFDLPAEATERALLDVIDRLNDDAAVNGILVQLPLPKGIEAERVIERIDWRKDVDGFHPYNVGRLVLKMPTLRPCTPLGCMRLLAETGVDLVGRHAVIIGQSNIVDGARAPDGTLHRHDLPLGDARSAGARAPGRHRRRSGRQGGLRAGRMDP